MILNDDLNGFRGIMFGMALSLTLLILVLGITYMQSEKSYDRTPGLRHIIKVENTVCVKCHADIRW